VAAVGQVAGSGSATAGPSSAVAAVYPAAVRFPNLGVRADLGVRSAHNTRADDQQCDGTAETACHHYAPRSVGLAGSPEGASGFPEFAC
jgi:hypothetical protein